jgi:hypothetical protein
MNKDRLMKLVRKLRFVQKNKPTKFNYARWVGQDWKGKADLSCGTTACALGFATTIPEFRKFGLRLHKTIDGGYVSWNNVHMGSGLNSSLYAAEQLFGISRDEANYLFTPNWSISNNGSLLQSPTSDASAGEVADHIVRFIAYKEKHSCRIW